MANQDARKKWATLQPCSTRLCSLVEDFYYDECLCAGARSRSEESAKRLCGGNFNACEVFREKRWDG